MAALDPAFKDGVTCGKTGIIGDVKQAKKKAPFRGALIVVGDERFELPTLSV
tara:strand:- start:1161 stop:1316 length:156 start_codon:yes stop_codon:yes gene_type:complete